MNLFRVCSQRRLEVHSIIPFDCRDHLGSQCGQCVRFRFDFIAGTVRCSICGCPAACLLSASGSGLLQFPWPPLRSYPHSLRKSPRRSSYRTSRIVPKHSSWHRLLPLLHPLARGSALRPLSIHAKPSPRPSPPSNFPSLRYAEHTSPRCSVRPAQTASRLI